MGTQTDIWSVTLEADADYYFAAASLADDSPLTLLKSRPGLNGIARQITITSTGDDDGVDFVVVGKDVLGNTLTETVTGPDTTTVTSTGYFAEITSITPDAGSTGNISVGYAQDVVLPKTRLRYAYYIASSSAGSIVVTRNSDSAAIFTLPTPATDKHTDSVLIPQDGISVAYDPADYATVTLTNVTTGLLLCG